MNRRNITLLITLAVVVLAAGVFAGWYYMSFGPGTPQGYINQRQSATKELAETSLSSVVSEAIGQSDDRPSLTESTLEDIDNACRSIKSEIDDLPSEAVAGADEPVESGYPLAELRADADRYYRLCDYLFKNEQFWSEIEEARSADIYTVNWERDCPTAEECNNFIRQDELALYIYDKVMPIHERANVYHTEVECPFAISGGEQLCTGLHNDLLAERNYDGTLRRILDRPFAKLDDRMLRLSENERQYAKELQQSFVRILGDYDNIYDLYIDEFERLKAKFAESAK